jgi:signal transduction histidine kinase
MARKRRKAFLDNEKRIILAFRFVVALVAFAFLFGQPEGVHVPWQFYFVMAVFLLSNVVFFLEQAQTFDTQRAQKYVFVFDVGMLTVLMLFLGLTNKEFYLVFLLTIFISAISKKTSHAFAISAVMAGLYVVFALHGKSDVDLASTPFLVRVILFFVVSSFVGHISEVAESSRRDVSRLTEWKERAEKLAVEQEKMAAVGLLAAGVAHEFNNLLAGIQGYADLARMDPTQMDEFADAVSGQCRRAAGLVRDLLSFSRKRGGEPGRVDVGEAVDQVLRLVRKELAARNIEVERRIAQVPHVEAEPGAVERTALNIVNNAIGAMDKDGKLIVTVSARNGDVLLAVKDNGRGMDAEILSRAFEPFFSTRLAEEGGVARATGLGLAVSKRLVERCGGSIQVESAPGKGTVATVRLPVAPKASEAGDRQQAGLGAASPGQCRHRPDRAEGEQK